jgi:hypothetical protein
MRTLNEVFSTLSTRRRYEVWFLRIGLADGSGAWWFRYLLMNPGLGGCTSNPQALPVQIWATWFPAAGRPRSFIQGLPLSTLNISRKGETPFHFQSGDNEIGEDFCRGALTLDGHQVSWNLRYRSTFRVTVSSKGWIGFSRTPHSDAIFSGEIALDGKVFTGDPLGFGVQGHNCGYRHRNFWRWMHSYFPRSGHPASTLEALVYEMPFSLVFRKAVLWHNGKEYVFRKLRERSVKCETMQWQFCCLQRDGLGLEATIDGRGPGAAHRLLYIKTDCKGGLEVVNNSLASASVVIVRGGTTETLETRTGAVLEMVG